MATAVVSGAAALLLARRPNLIPDQVKALLVGTTQPYGQDSGQVLPDPIADGSGLLDAYAAVNTAPPPAPSPGRARSRRPLSRRASWLVREAEDFSDGRLSASLYGLRSDVGIGRGSPVRG